jgi:hypothetical protein
VCAPFLTQMERQIILIYKKRSVRRLVRLT